MPDMQSELTKLIRVWDEKTRAENAQEHQPKEKTVYVPTQTDPQPTETAVANNINPTTTVTHPPLNITRTIFNLVRDNPGIGYEQCLQQVTLLGARYESVRSLIGQFLTAGIMEMRDGSMLFTTEPEYVSPTSRYREIVARKQMEEELKRKAEITAKRLATRMANKNKLQHEKPAPAPVAPVAVAPVAVPDPVSAATFNPAEIVESLTLRQARALYDELKKIFG